MCVVEHVYAQQSTVQKCEPRSHSPLIVCGVCCVHNFIGSRRKNFDFRRFASFSALRIPNETFTSEMFVVLKEMGIVKVGCQSL